MKTYWVSFGTKHGVVITDAENEQQALDKLRRLRLHSGGEAMLFDMPHPEAQEEIAQWGKDRLISPLELFFAGNGVVKHANKHLIAGLVKGVSLIPGDEADTKDQG